MKDAGPFTADELNPPRDDGAIKNTPADRKVAADAYSVTADELRSFIEREEQLASERADLNTQSKELFAEAKGRGYDTKVMRKIIALRKRRADDIAEEEAIMEMYRAALGMK